MTSNAFERQPSGTRSLLRTWLQWAQDRAGVKPFFAFIAAGIFAVTALEAALLWDGSFVLFIILETGSTFANNNRLSNILLQWPVVLISQLTDNTTIINMVFSLPYVSVPFVSLLLSWFVVRNRAPNLFVWPVLGIGLGTLPGQMCFICDSTMTVQLIWPILLVIAVGLTLGNLVVVLAVGVFIFFLHPVSTMAFGISTIFALAVALNRKDIRRSTIFIAVVLFALTCLRLFMSAATATDYEESQLSIDTQIFYFEQYVLWLPLIALLAAWAAGMAIGIPALRANRRAAPFGSRLLFGLPLVAVLLSGLLLLILAGTPHLWKDGLSFRGFGTISYLPFVILLVAEVLLKREVVFRSKSRVITTIRLLAIYATGFVFFSVVTLQGIVFWELSNDLEEFMIVSSDPCIERYKIDAVRDTPLDNWSLPVLAIVLQGKTPETLVLDDEGCIEAAGTGPLNLVPWQEHQNGRWFDLQEVRSRTRIDSPCVFVLSQGWYELEQASWGWWRWTAGRGVVRIFVQRETNVIIQGGLTSIHSKDGVDIVVNGETQRVLDAGSGSFESFEPVAVTLQPGENIIEFIGHTAPTMVAGDPRSLAFAVSDLQVETVESGTSCEPSR